MNALQKKRYLLAGFIASLLILMAVNIYAYIRINAHLDSERWVRHILTIIETSEHINYHTTNAEANRRAYWMTGSEEFYKNYQEDIKGIDSALAELKFFVKGDSLERILVDSLETHISAGKDVHRQSIEAQINNPADAKKQAGFTFQRKEIKEKIIILIDSLQSVEKSFLKSKYEEAGINANTTLTSMLLGTSISFILLITTFIVINRNINKRMRTEKVLEGSRNWFSTTLRSIGDAVIVTNGQGAVEFMNPVAEKLTGWKEDEAHGLNLEKVFKLIDEDSGLRQDNPVARVMESGTAASLTNHSLLISKSGEKIPVDDSAAPIKNTDGTLTGVVLVFRDISQRRKAEQELLESKRFVQKIADSSPNILYVYELEGPRLTYTSSRIKDVLGYSPEEAVEAGSRFFSELVHPDDYREFQKLFKKYRHAADNEVLDFEFRLKNSRGEWHWFRTFDVVFERDKNGDAIKMLGASIDVTEKKKLQEELQRYSIYLEELVEARTHELKEANEKFRLEVAERLKAERSIKLAEDKFRYLVENSLVGICIVKDWRFVYVNPKYEEILGYKAGELSGISLWSTVAVQSREVVRESIRKRIEEDVEAIHYTYKAIRKDGRIIDVEVQGSVMRLDEGIATIGTVQDITDRLKSQEILDTQRRFLRTVIDTDPNFVFAKDMDGRFTLVNKAVADVYGTSVKELIGKTDADFNPNKDEVEHFLKDDREVMVTLIPKLIPEERVSNSTTGETRWYQTIKVPLILPDGTRQVLGVSTDITERKNAEQELRESEEKFRIIAETATDGIITIDDSSTTLFANKAAENIFGYSHDELIGKPLNKIIPNWYDSIQHNLLIDYTKTGKKTMEWKDFQVKGIGKSNKIIPLEISFGEYFHADKHYFTGIIRDITERMDTHSRMLSSLREKEILLKEIHHRVKNNLQIIVSLLKLQTKYVHDARDAEILNKSRARVEMMALIHEKLYKSEDLSNINFGNYIRELSQHLVKAYGVNVDVDLVVKTDEIHLGIDTAIPCGLIINELITNSLKDAFKPGEKGIIELELHKSDERLIMSVSDNGIGLQPDIDIEKLDSLGLQLVKTLVKQLGGKMDVVTTDGTKFIFTFEEIKYSERI